MSWVIREYKQNDLGGCQQLMASNTPRYFDPSEVDEFTEDLHKREAQSAARRWPYFVLVTNQLVRACGGYVIFPDNTAGLLWGMVGAHEHRQGLGSQLLRYRLDHMPVSVNTVKLDTTPESFTFYRRFGFEQCGFEKDGYGPGLDKVLARLTR